MDKSIYLIGALWIIYVIVLIPSYIKKENQYGSVGAVSYKMILSAVFCLTALVSVIRNHAGLFSVLIFFAMIFSLIGDFYLAFLKENVKKFIIGIISFGTAQVLYITSMFVMEGIHITEFIVTAVIILPLWIGLNIVKPDMGKAKLWLVIYFTLVTLMASKAVFMAFRGNAPVTRQEIFSSGALLFYISDVFLGTTSFIKQKKLFNYIVTICYFIGQLMIATAVYFQV